MLLRKVKQKPGENVQVNAERLLALADDAFIGLAGPAADRQVIGLFIDGLTFDYMKMKVMRENPATLQAAITAAINEHLRKRFDLRSGNKSFCDNSYGVSTSMATSQWRSISLVHGFAAIIVIVQGTAPRIEG